MLFLVAGHEATAATLAWLVLALHRHPAITSRLRTEITDRFAPPREEDRRTPYSLVGFGAGPRTCTGKAFAVLLMQSFTSAAVRSYELAVLDDQDLSPVLVRATIFMPRSGLQLKVLTARESAWVIAR